MERNEEETVQVGNTGGDEIVEQDGVSDER